MQSKIDKLKSHLKVVQNVIRRAQEKERKLPDVVSNLQVQTDKLKNHLRVA